MHPITDFHKTFPRYIPKVGYLLRLNVRSNRLTITRHSRHSSFSETTRSKYLLGIPLIGIQLTITNATSNQISLHGHPQTLSVVFSDEWNFPFTAGCNWDGLQSLAEIAPPRKRTYKSGAHPHRLHPEIHNPISQYTKRWLLHPGNIGSNVLIMDIPSH